MTHRPSVVVVAVAVLSGSSCDLPTGCDATPRIDAASSRGGAREARPPEPLTEPLPPGATQNARRQAVLRLVAGGQVARDLEEMATDPGTTFRYDLRYRIYRAPEPKVSIDVLGLDEAERAKLSRVIRQNYGRFLLCFGPELDEEPNLQATLRARFTIGRDGNVYGLRPLWTDSRHRQMENCVLRHLAKVRYERPDGQVPVQVTVELGFRVE